LKAAAVIRIQDGLGIIAAFAIFAMTALLCALLIILLRPLLARYAIAHPNPRSSHKVPTLQGGGIAVIAATIASSCAALCFFPADSTAPLQFPVVAAAVIFISAVGVLGDIHPQNVTLRLLLQTVAVAAVIFALPPELRIFPILPLMAERILLVIGGLWFVNLVNFMDGLDLMTVAEVVPITAGAAVIGAAGILPAPIIAVSLALCGAMVGFSYFNRPVAKLFLGDVGSLPVGLMVGWLLVLIAGHGARGAAILLPLYYLADSTITLIRRALTGEKIWQAHRSHFYQRATDRGFSARDVVTRVFAINLGLCSFALATVLFPSWFVTTIALVSGAALVVGLLVTLARGKWGAL
jgi:UDP-N-acetylmuramyl pentapeptide phosphotransferase/UDP-N-acetylglucosamine-1-phosphate transferase